MPDVRRSLCHPRKIVNWEATQVAGPAGPGWHPDPLDPARLRWWDGTIWSARVARLEAGSEGIAWHAGIADLAAPDPLTVAPPVPIAGAGAAPWAPAPAAATPGPWAPTPTEITLSAPDGAMRAHPRRSRRAWAMLGAAVLILAAGAGAGTAMLSGGERPTVEDTITYRDDAADFALRYPMAWRVDERSPGEGVIFVIGAKDALPLDENTVSVVAGTSPDQPFVPLDALVSRTSADLVAKLPNFRLVSATEARLAGAPAFRLEFVDSTTKPAKLLVQVAGRTTSGRPLIVVMTVREPRTAPSDEELHRFLASITSS